MRSHNDPDRVLCVDDAPAARAVFRRTARQVGFRVDVADGYRQALVRARARGYAVVAVAYRVGRESGLAVIERLRRVLPLASFVLICGVHHMVVACRAVQQHRVSYLLQRPWATEDVRWTMRRALEEHWDQVQGSRVPQAASAL